MKKYDLPVQTEILKFQNCEIDFFRYGSNVMYLFVNHLIMALAGVGADGIVLQYNFFLMIQRCCMILIIRTTHSQRKIKTNIIILHNYNKFTNRNSFARFW